jgi:hypothetical protein
MSLNDKILDCFKPKLRANLSTDDVRRILEKEFEIKRSNKTIQRHIKQLIDDQELEPIIAIGREQSYRLKSVGSQQVLPYDKDWEQAVHDIIKKILAERPRLKQNPFSPVLYDEIIDEAGARLGEEPRDLEFRKVICKIIKKYRSKE